MMVGRALGNDAKLSADKVSERSDVCKIHEKKFLSSRTGRSYNVKGVVGVRVGLLVREDQDDLLFVNKYVSLYSDGISPAYHSELLASC
jgi:hypothetical protein